MIKNELLPNWFAPTMIGLSFLLMIYGGYDFWIRGYKDVASMIWIISPFVTILLIVMHWWDRTLNSQFEELENKCQQKSTTPTDLTEASKS